MLNTEEQVGLLLKLAFICTVKDRESGRITLKVGIMDLPRLTSLLTEIDDLEEEISRVPGYISHKTHIGLTGGSVVIRYDASVFPDDLWDDLSRLRDKPNTKDKVAQRLRSLFEGNPTGMA
jgi:hypothetical protein